MGTVVVASSCDVVGGVEPDVGSRVVSSVSRVPMVLMRWYTVIWAALAGVVKVAVARVQVVAGGSVRRSVQVVVPVVVRISATRRVVVVDRYQSVKV